MALVILWAKSPSLRTRASIPSAVLSFAAALAMYSLSYMEHTRSIRPSTLLEVYLLFSILLDIPQARTLFIRHNNVPIAAVYVVSVVAKVVLWALESRNKAKHLKEPYQEYPPEATRGIVNRILFCWLNSFLVKGFKGLLSIDDVYQLDPSLSSEPLRDSMQTAWDSRCKNHHIHFKSLQIADRYSSAKPEHRHALLWACARCLRWPLLAAVPPRICLIAFNYAQPFLITRLISFVSEPTTPQTHNHGLGLIAATAVVYCGIAVSKSHSPCWQAVDHLCSSLQYVTCTRCTELSLCSVVH
jgi:ATP-binding cassette, subfamily C (CFTR/MRP), member 1